MRSPRTPTKSSPCSLQLEKARAQQRRPNAAKKHEKKQTRAWWVSLCVFLLSILHDFVGEQNLPPQNMSLWHINYFKLLFSKKRPDVRKTLKPRSYSFIRNIYICKNISLYQEVENDQISRNSYQWRRQNLNLRNSLTLVCCTFPGHLSKVTRPHPQHPLLSSAEDAV